MRFIALILSFILASYLLSSCGGIGSGGGNDIVSPDNNDKGSDRNNNGNGDDNNNNNNDGGSGNDNRNGNDNRYVNEDLKYYILASAAWRGIVVAVGERVNIYYLGLENSYGKITNISSLAIDIVDLVVKSTKDSILSQGTILRSCSAGGFIYITTDDTTGQFSISYNNCDRGGYEYNCEVSGTYMKDASGNISQVSMTIEKGCTITYSDGEILEFLDNLNYNATINKINDSCTSGFGMNANFNVNGGYIKFYYSGSSEYALISYENLSINFDASCSQRDVYDYGINGVIYYFDNYCIKTPNDIRLEVNTPVSISFSVESNSYANCGGIIDITDGNQSVRVNIWSDCSVTISRNGSEIYSQPFIGFIYVAGMCSFD